MNEEHELHHLHAFLPRLGAAMPALVSVLEDGERPDGGRPTEAWVRRLNPRRRLEICRLWVRDGVGMLRRGQPGLYELLGVTLLLQGEFSASDVAALVPAFGGDPVAAEERLTALCECGLMIFSAMRRLYCVPFPLRLVYDHEPFLDLPDESEAQRRVIAYFADVARQWAAAPETPREAGWRFDNVLGAYEIATKRSKERTTPDEGEDDALVLFADRLGRALLKRASDGTANLLEASAVAARRLGRTDDEGRVLFDLAKFWIERRQAANALRSFQRCAEVRATAGDDAGLAMVATAMAFLLRDGGDREGAIAQFNRAHAAAARARMADHQRHIAQCAANMLLAAGEARAAQQWLEPAARSRDDGTEKSPEDIDSLLLLGRSLSAQGDAGAAEAHLLEAASQARARSLHPRDARASMLLAQLLAAGGRHDEALAWGERALHLYEDMNDPDGRSAACLELSRSAMAGQSDDLAAEWCERGLSARPLTRENAVQAALHEVRAELHTRAGDVEAARTEFHHAADVWRSAGEGQALARTWLRLAGLHEQCGDHARACCDALRAQGIARAMRLKELADTAHEAVTRLREAAGEDVFETLVFTVSEELEMGRLVPERRSRQDCD